MFMIFVIPLNSLTHFYIWYCIEGKGRSVPFKEQDYASGFLYSRQLKALVIALREGE